MKKKIIMILIFIIGLGIFLYPNVSNIYAEYNQARIVWDYKKQQNKLAANRKEEQITEFEEYNKSIEEGTISYIDPFIEEGATLETGKVDETRDRLGEPIGHIEIPKIGIDIPIYQGTTERVLQRAVGLLEGSSMPIGGEGTHAALTGHRGLPNAELFTNIVDMSEGDIFYLHSVAGTLAYEVESILTVLPYETESLAIQEGRDLVTLITCTPYMINTHRLLITGKRIPYVAPSVEEQGPTSTSQRFVQLIVENEQNIWVYVIGAGSVILLILSILIFRRRKGDEHHGD